ncbi:MAG: anti-sigma factor domain-containing protein [Gemmatimonadales bacterium]
MEYATRILDADDTVTFTAHLRHCEECRGEVSRIEMELAWLPMGLPPAASRPGLQRRIIQHVLDDTRVTRSRWLLPAAAVAASLMLAVAGWIGGRRQTQALQTEVAALETRAAALADTLSVMRGAARVLQTSVEVGGQRGGLVIFADETTHRWSVVVHGLPPAPAGTGYQFWFICADGMVRGSGILPAGPGSTMFTTGMPETGGAVLGAALTVEPLDAKAGPPRGTEVAHLML